MKVAVAGLGWWGKQIIRCLDQSEKFEVLYGVDPKPPADVAAFAKEFGVKVVPDLKTVLSDGAVDGVILATPHSLHEEQILAVVGAGKNVFCEKPLTMTAAGAERALEACAKAGKVLGIGHERRWEPAFEEVARLVKAGTLGKLLHVDANFSHDLFRRMDQSNWRLDPAHAPAGMMSVTPFYGRFTLYGDAGWVEVVSEGNVDQGKPAHLTFCNGDKRETKSYEAIDTVILNFESWADAVAGRAPYRFTPEQILENIKIFEAVVRSSQQNGATISF
jgi:predicted dehydrogenase